MPVGAVAAHASAVRHESIRGFLLFLHPHSLFPDITMASLAANAPNPARRLHPLPLHRCLLAACLLGVCGTGCTYTTYELGPTSPLFFFPRHVNTSLPGSGVRFEFLEAGYPSPTPAAASTSSPLTAPCS